MAAKKSVVKTVAKLPAGFQAVATGGGGQWHNWEENPVLQGTVTAMGSFEGEYGKQRTMTVKDSKGVESTVSESGALKELFNKAKKGKQVYIQLVGVVKLKNKKTGKPNGKTYKQFTAGIK